MTPELLVVNKPVGKSSHDIVNIVRKKTGVRRVGHAGTLDPLASGVLLILIGRDATKRQAEFMGLPKEYQAEVTFGSTSATDDAEGPIASVATLEQLLRLTKEQVVAVLPRFIGTIRQKPPAFSAIKLGGEAAYKKARRGDMTTADMAARDVTIDAIELLQWIPATPPFPPTARLRVACHKGTYIRSLARDIGEALGVGAYLSQLVRTKIGPYTLDHARSLDQLDNA